MSRNIPQPLEITPEKEYDRRLYMDGFADQSSGEVDSPETGHFYRIGSRVTMTNDQGFSTCYRFGYLPQAVEFFEYLEEIYARWINETNEDA